MANALSDKIADLVPDCRAKNPSERTKTGAH